MHCVLVHMCGWGMRAVKWLRYVATLLGAAHSGAFGMPRCGSACDCEENVMSVRTLVMLSSWQLSL